MTPTAQHGGRNRSAAGRFFFALRHGGILVAIFAFRTGIPHHWQLFLTTGILGGYTTFSTFSLDVALLYERGQIGLAALYVLLSVGGLFAGLALVRNLA